MAESGRNGALVASRSAASLDELSSSRRSTASTDELSRSKRNGALFTSRSTAPTDELSRSQRNGALVTSRSTAPVDELSRSQSGTAAKVPSSLLVAVRARPLEKHEGPSALKVTPTSVTVSAGKVQHSFEFDYAYDGQSTQETIYHDLGAPILHKALQGFNATIFAYGQTGSGKSHTMMGPDGDMGIIPRMIQELFLCVEKLRKESPDKKFLLTCSYLEIYNEVLQDLLVPPGSKRSQEEQLTIKEHQTLGVYVKGLLEIPVRSRVDLVKLMLQGNARRSTGETNMNARSSRSHSIYSIRIQQQERISDTDQKRETWSKINLVDLAGSERVSKTGAKGARMKEGISINQSLSALGGVITALADSAKKGKMQYIPYRNSKLTRVLQESLGGNSLTVMIANVSSLLGNLDETYNTLQYADRAKAIQVKAIKNEHMSEVGQLRQEVELLKQRLAEQVGRVATEEEEQELQQYRSQLEEYEMRLQQSFEEKAHVCSILEDKLKDHQKQIELQHQQRRTQAESDGRWLHVFEANNPIWQRGALLDTLRGYQCKQRDAEENLDRCNLSVTVSCEILSELVADLEQCEVDEQVASSDDLSTTIDVSSPKGSDLLRKLCSGEQARLHRCRYVLLRLQALQKHLQQSQRIQDTCISLCEEICQALANSEIVKSMQNGSADVQADDAAEAGRDIQCAASLIQQKIQELRSQSFPEFRQICLQLLQVLLRSHRNEAKSLCELSTAPKRTESVRAVRQRMEEAATRLEELEVKVESWSRENILDINNDVINSLEVLERAIGQRLLEQQRQEQPFKAENPLQARSETTATPLRTPRGSIADSLANAAALVHGSPQATSGSKAVDLANAAALDKKSIDEQQELKKELETLKKQHQQMEKQSQLSEKLLDEHAQQERKLRERADNEERRSSELQTQVSDLQEQISSLQQQMEQQAEEVASAQALEQQFAHLAAEMGCVDQQGHLMRQELDRVTLELLQAREREAEYHRWLQDVKRSMEAGNEDRYIMALAEVAEGMTACRNRDKVIREKELVIRRKEEIIRKLHAERFLPPAAEGPLMASTSPQQRSRRCLPPNPASMPSRSRSVEALGIPVSSERPNRYKSSGTVTLPVQGGIVNDVQSASAGTATRTSESLATHAASKQPDGIGNNVQSASVEAAPSESLERQEATKHPDGIGNDIKPARAGTAPLSSESVQTRGRQGAVKQTDGMGNDIKSAWAGTAPLSSESVQMQGAVKQTDGMGNDVKSAWAWTDSRTSESLELSGAKKRVNEILNEVKTAWTRRAPQSSESSETHGSIKQPEVIGNDEKSAWAWTASRTSESSETQEARKHPGRILNDARSAWVRSAPRSPRESVNALLQTQGAQRRQESGPLRRQDSVGIDVNALKSVLDRSARIRLSPRSSPLNSPRASPRASPRTSPQSSPRRSPRKSVAFEMQGVGMHAYGMVNDVKLSPTLTVASSMPSLPRVKPHGV